MTDLELVHEIIDKAAAGERLTASEVTELRAWAVTVGAVIRELARTVGVALSSIAETVEDARTDLTALARPWADVSALVAQRQAELDVDEDDD